MAEGGAIRSVSEMSANSSGSQAQRDPGRRLPGGWRADRFSGAIYGRQFTLLCEVGALMKECPPAGTGGRWSSAFGSMPGQSNTAIRVAVRVPVASQATQAGRA